MSSKTLLPYDELEEKFVVGLRTIQAVNAVQGARRWNCAH